MNQKLLRKLANESVINPKDKNQPLGLIIQQNNPNYLEIRAKEFISEAQLSLSIHENHTEHQLALYHDKMTKAITLLLLARAMRI